MDDPYYTVAVLRKGRWEPEFGDFDAGPVLDETEELVEQGEAAVILITEEGQDAINARLAQLNEGS